MWSLVFDDLRFICYHFTCVYIKTCSCVPIFMAFPSQCYEYYYFDFYKLKSAKRLNMFGIFIIVKQ